MSTGTDIIKDALSKIGVHSVASPANPESIELGRKVLNSMCETWLTRGINIGFTPLSVPGDDLNEPADTRNGIVMNLAVELSPDFDNGRQIVSPTLMMLASKHFSQIKRSYESITIPSKVVSSTLPKGQGNLNRYNDDRTYFREGGTVDG